MDKNTIMKVGYLKIINRSNNQIIERTQFVIEKLTLNVMH